MAGHSHSANIAIRKGAQDKKRGALFGQLSKAIMVAARNGGSDIATNLRLRYAIDKARANSMPRENIERAVKKGCGELEGETYEELVYEGYGPAGTAILCDALTDNRNRTSGELRSLFEKGGGNLGATNCVSYMFERKGLFVIPAGHCEEDRLMEIALGAGADDVALQGTVFEVTCDPNSFETLRSALDDAKIACDSAEITRIAANKVDLDLENAIRVLKLISTLEENEDVQSVTSNYQIPDDILPQVQAALGDG
jgi:YebC/PmpR family DNA-binding regulatory protein